MIKLNKLTESFIEIWKTLVDKHIKDKNIRNNNDFIIQFYQKKIRCKHLFEYFLSEELTFDYSHIVFLS